MSDDLHVTPYTNDHPLETGYMTESLAKNIILFVDALIKYESEWHDYHEFIDPHLEPMSQELLGLFNRLMQERWVADR